jgi:hypothetical protein
MMTKEIVREPFVFESVNKEPVERTMERLNRVSTDKTYSIDCENNIWYVFEVTDEDEI